MDLPLVVIVGAPNVGKSTLFNRLVRARRAIVTDEPGVTRDRLYGEVRDVDRPFRLVDTGGLTPRGGAPFAEEIERQADAAMADGVCLLFVVDARAGVTAVDREVAERLRKRGLPILLVANKVDTPKTEPLVHELYELGLGDPIALSAEHAIGIDTLLDRIAELLGRRASSPTSESARGEARPLELAIVGRPNVGKSSLLNRLVGQERVMVSDIPGTTRDSVDTVLSRGGRHYRLIDTAGIRRRGKVRLRAERFSVARARLNIGRSDVAVVVIDASQPFSAQDAHIAGYAADAYKPLLLAVNKWDLVAEREDAAKRWTVELRRRLRFARLAPVLFISARTGQRVARVLELADELHVAAGRQVSTPEINRCLREIDRPDHPGPGNPRLLYATQTGTHPPRFLVFCNDPSKLHFSLKRRVENVLRDRFGFDGAPIRLDFRGRRE